MVTSLSILSFDITIGPLLLIVSFIVLFYIWTQYRQKIELIKKGESIVKLDSLEQMKTSHLSKGIIAISLALGIFLGHILDIYTSLNSWVSYVSMFLLFFGVGALIFYGLIKNQ